MQKVVREVLFDDIPFIATADYKVVDAVVGVGLEDVPKDGLAADLNHRLGPGRGFFGDSGAEATCKNNCFHFLSMLTSS